MFQLIKATDGIYECYATWTHLSDSDQLSRHSISHNLRPLALEYTTIRPPKRHENVRFILVYILKKTHNIA